MSDGENELMEEEEEVEVVVIPYRRTPLHWLRYYEPTFMAYATFVFNKLKF